MSNFSALDPGGGGNQETFKFQKAILGNPIPHKQGDDCVEDGVEGRSYT